MGEQNAHRRGKGKGKEKEPMTFASRLASSASGMAKSTLDNTCARHLPATISSSTLLGHKAVPGPAPRTLLHWPQDLPGRLSTPFSPQGHAESSQSSFRSTPTNEQPDLEFNEFLDSSRNLCPLDLDTLNELLISSTSIIDSPSLATDKCLDPLDHPDPTSAIQNSRPFLPQTKAGFDQDKTVSDDVRYSSSENAWPVEHSFNVPVDLVQQHHEAQYSNTQALPRLRMILDHVSELENHALGHHHGQISHLSLHALSQRWCMADQAASRGLTHMSLEHKENVNLSDTTVQHLSKWGNGASPSQRRRDTRDQQLPEVQSRIASRDAEQHPEPSFHCPWTRCHQVCLPSVRVSLCSLT